MSTQAEAFATAAEALIGAPFRLYGRSAATGLDCVGLVDQALRTAGQEPVSLPAYGLRNANYDFVTDIALRSGLALANGPIIRGDLLAVCPGPAQLHLLIASNANHFVHAHASLHCVVTMPGPLAWPILHQFRFTKKV